MVSLLAAKAIEPAEALARRRRGAPKGLPANENGAPLIGGAVFVWIACAELPREN